MGSSESTGRSNGTEKEEEEQRRRQQNSGGGFTEAATAVTIVAGVAVAAWGISRMLSDDTDSQEKDDPMAIKPQGKERSLSSPSIRRYTGYEGDNQPCGFSPPPDRFRINSDGGYNSTKGLSSGYGGVFTEGDYRGYQGAKQRSTWHPPPRGRFKMNTAAVSGPNPGSSAYAGILRNDRGEWVRGFMGFIGVAGIQTAEIYGIFKGLKLLDELGLKASILESDSEEAVLWIKGKNKLYYHPKPNSSHCTGMITECMRLALKNNTTIDNINGDDANRCADKLAAAALIVREEYFEIEELPNGIKNLVDKDKESKIHGTEPSFSNPNIRGYVGYDGSKQLSNWSRPRGDFKIETDGDSGSKERPSIRYEGRLLRNNEAKKGSSVWSAPGRGRFKMNTKGSSVWSAPGLVSSWSRSKQLSNWSRPRGDFKIETDGDSGSKERPSIRYEGRLLRNNEAKKGSSVWSAPGRGRFKMNTDGACRPNPGGPSGYGGILRKDHGEWVCGFYGFIGGTDGLTAEFHGILKGLQVLDKLGLVGSVLETDCKAAFEWVTELKDGPSKSKVICDCWNIITECRKLWRINDITINKIGGKNANKCADKLAAKALKEQKEYMEIDDLPDEIKNFVDKDKKSPGLVY